VLASVRDRYDVVLIDTPPATVVADALVVLGAADAAIVVSRMGAVTGKAFARLREQLSAIDKPILGTIVNGGAPTREYGYAAYAPTGDPAAATVSGGAHASASREASAASPVSDPAR
jgi:protein-tyrosine kinase